MHGNRDFLLGPEFASSYMKLISDPYVEEMFGSPVLLMHGDLLVPRMLIIRNLGKLAEIPNGKRFS